MVHISRFVSVALCCFLFLGASAQVCHNLYPYALGAVDDNNGNDLAGFIKTAAADAKLKSGLVRQYSDGNWGYLQVKTVKMPSVDIRRVDDKFEKVHLNFSQSIDVTLALGFVADGLKATWWSRQCNNPRGPLFQKTTDDDAKLDIPCLWYTDITKTMAARKFTLVEYYTDRYNNTDYSELLKNSILVESGLLKDANEYKAVIDFYNGFLSKFTYVEDPLLEDKSFVTFFTSGNDRFIGYFNIENNQLSGHLLRAGIEFPADRDTVVSHVFQKLTTKKIYVYGDDVFGLEKTMLRYAYVHKLKLIRRKTSDSLPFNKEK